MIGWQTNDVQIIICGWFIGNCLLVICSKTFLILFGEFAVSDSIIVLVIQYSFWINSANFCVHIPKSFTFVDQHQAHFLGKLYCALHI
ncbi:MAG: hypothetical protein WCG25_05025 [bacterium]